MSVTVSLEEIVDHLNMVGDESSAYLNRKTGELVMLAGEELSAAEERERPGGLSGVATGRDCAGERDTRFRRIPGIADEVRHPRVPHRGRILSLGRARGGEGATAEKD